MERLLRMNMAVLALGVAGLPSQSAPSHRTPAARSSATVSSFPVRAACTSSDMSSVSWIVLTLLSISSTASPTVSSLLPAIPNSSNVSHKLRPSASQPATQLAILSSSLDIVVASLHHKLHGLCTKPRSLTRTRSGELAACQRTSCRWQCGRARGGGLRLDTSQY